MPTRYCVDVAGFKELVTENVNDTILKVKASLEKARANYKRHYDKVNKVSEKYRLGQRVMVFDPRADTSDAKKLNWKFYGPFRIVDIEGANAKVRPVDKPNAKTEWLPLNRLGKLPDECEQITGDKKQRSKVIAQEQTAQIFLVQDTVIWKDQLNFNNRSPSTSCQADGTTRCTPSNHSKHTTDPKMTSNSPKPIAVQSGDPAEDKPEQMDTTPANTFLAILPDTYRGFCDSETVQII